MSASTTGPTEPAHDGPAEDHTGEVRGPDPHTWHEIVQLHLRFARALDTKDWGLYRACLADTITAHYQGAGLPQVSVPADLWTTFVAAAVTPQTTVHYFTNFTPDPTSPSPEPELGEVRCRFNHQSCHRVETHGAGDATLVQYGTYGTTVVPGELGWRITRIHHQVAWSVGNPALVGADPELERASAQVFGSTP